MNLVLTGFMGTGKTAAGKIVAKMLGFGFVDTDELVEKSAEIPISEIFADHGEEVFRQMESEAVEAVAELDNLVISCGGGVVLNPRNLEALRQKGIIINFTASPEAVYERVKHETHRPLLRCSDPLSEIRKILKTRENAYKMNDFSIDTTKLTVEQAAAKAVEAFKSKLTK